MPARYELDFDERFDRPELDPARWVAHYLPEWTTPERSAARYELGPDGLALRIDADQPAWWPPEGELRVSNLQTGTWSGPAGSDRGQMRHREDLVVASPQPSRRLYTPTHGRFEAELRASDDPTVMLAFWLVAHAEGGPEQAGELCVAELFGHAVGPRRSTVNIGLKAHGDPRLTEDMAAVELDLDASQWHTYGVDWTPEHAAFHVDGQLVRTVAQRLAYPLQLMVDLFEFPPGPERPPAAYPKVGGVRAVRGYRPV